MDSFYDFLTRRLDQNLPGHAAQLEMAPKPSGGRVSYIPDANNVRVSAVLILLYQAGNDIYDLLFTLRSKTLPTHKGQISFPGGRVSDNESIFDAALRETFEEVGIDSGLIHILGTITGLYIPNSKSYIYPVVGYTEQKPDMTLNRDEVQEAFFISLNQLSDKNNIKTTEWDLHNSTYQVPFWDIHSTTPLWGATAMIVSEFVTIYKEFVEKGR